MAIVSDTGNAKLSLVLIIIYSISFGLFGGLAFVDWLSDSVRYLARLGVAVTSFGVVLIYAYKVWDFMGSIAADGTRRAAR